MKTLQLFHQATILKYFACFQVLIIIHNVAEYNFVIFAHILYCCPWNYSQGVELLGVDIL